MSLPDLIRKFVNLLLFGNFFIAGCAIAMTLQTNLLLFGNTIWRPLFSFIFFATLFLYAIHRIVGLKKVAPFLEKYRYTIIYYFRHHIKLYALLGGAGAIYFFFQISFANQLLLIIPSILSLGYVLPLLKGERRFRDLDYLKIFLVAIVWGVITVLMPIFEHSTHLILSHYLLLLERILFIFAITLPFDIRDLKIDAHLSVKTIPARIGILNTKKLAIFLLSIAFCCALFNWMNGLYSPQILAALFVSFLSTGILILYSDRMNADYFFTGMMDGTMILQFLLVLYIVG